MRAGVAAPPVGGTAWLLIVPVLLAACHGTERTPGFVTTQGDRFVLDGEEFAFVGTNAFYLLDAASYGSRAATDEAMAAAKAHGFRVLRTWGFKDGAPEGGASLQPRARTYDEEAFRAMDYVLYQADRAGVRLLISLVNNGPEYGGRPQNVEWCAPGQPLDAFYTEPACRQLDRDYVRHVLDQSSRDC